MKILLLLVSAFLLFGDELPKSRRIPVNGQLAVDLGRDQERLNQLRADFERIRLAACSEAGVAPRECGQLDPAGRPEVVMQ